MTGSSLIDLSSGFSGTRSTFCDRLASIDRSQVLGVAVLHAPEQPIGQASWTAELHIVSDEHDCARTLSASACFTFQPLASIVNFLSGSVRSKLVTSELIRPQPPELATAPSPSPAIIKRKQG